MRTFIAFTAAALSIALVRPAFADPLPASNAPRAVAPVDAVPAPRAAPAPRATPAPGGAAPSGAPTLPPPLPALDTSVIAAPCKPLVAAAQAPSVARALSARITLATCMADHAIASIALCDCAASVVAIDGAAAPALAVLDDVIDAGDPAAQVLAEHAEGELYAGFIRRLVATLPRTGPEASDAEVALADMRRQTLDAQLAPWREAALTEFQRAVEIARAHPELASDPAVAGAVRDSEQRLSGGVAPR